MPDDLKDSILSIFEASLDPQLRAVRRLRSGQPEPAPARRRQGLSQVDMAYDILKKARTPLHISQLLARIHSTFHLTVDRESLVSSLTKKIARGDRFIRTDKNTFGLRPEAPGPCSPLGSPSWPTGAPVSLNRVPFTAPSARPWVPWCAWAGAACRASSGPHGGQHRSWSREYFLHSRCPWEPPTLFAPMLRRALAFCPGRLLGVAVDDTRVRKTGRSIPQAFYQRDPLSPPLHVNLILGLRFLQASLLVPWHRRGPVACRALPIRFEEVSRVKKPSRKAGEEAWKEYKRMTTLYNLSQRFVQSLGQLRQQLDAAGGKDKILVLAGDGSFCNRTCLRAPRDRTQLIARARKDARLCFRAPQNSRRFYDSPNFTPEQGRQDDSRPWKQTKLFYGGKRRKIRYKDLVGVYWRRGGGQIPLRLLVVAPTPYRKRQSSKLYYRQPAYLLTTDLQNSAQQLLQIYFDRWQIEVNPRDEKDTLGVGQAQLWNVHAVPKQPVLVVAAYSALLLASLQAFGTERGKAYQPLPKWRRNAYRPSCLDLVTLLRKEMVDHPELTQHLDVKVSDRGLTQAAVA